MKHFFSITLMVAGIKNILIRFPFSAIIALLGSLMAISLTYDDFYSEHWQPYIIKSIYLCALAIPLFISIRLFLESVEFKPLYSIIIKITALILLGGFYLQIPAKLNTEFYIQYFFTNLALQLSVIFISFLNLKSNNNDLIVWHFNKIIFLRFLGAFLATLVLFAGLALALVAIDVLLDFSIDEDNYFRLWIFLSGVFCTYFFLAGIPNASKIFTESAIPNSLKIFIQYVIIPIIAVFSIILNLYLFKIIVSWNIPKGWVIYLVSGYFALGLLTTILLFPIRDKLNSKIFILFKHSFYYTTLPFIIVFFIAIIIRIQQYGFTESRILVLLLGIWMLFVNLYILFIKNYKITIIPLTFAAIALLSVYGPWSIFRLSENSQRQQFIQLLENNNMLQNNKAIAATKPIIKQDAFRLMDIIDYFNAKEKLLFLQPIFTNNLDSIFRIDTLNSYYFKKDKMLEILNISRKDYYENSKQNFYFSNEKNNNIIDISGYSHMINLNENYYNYAEDTVKWIEKTIKTGYDSVVVSINFEEAIIKISINEYLPTTINLLPMLTEWDSISDNESENSYELPEKFLSLQCQTDSVKIKLLFTSINGKKTDSTKYVIQNISGTLLLKILK